MSSFLTSSPYAEPLDKQVVSSTAVNQNLKDKCLGVLRKVSQTHRVLPKSYFPPGVTLPSDPVPHASGGFADVLKGQLDGNDVCVKAFRVQTAANPDKIKQVCGSPTLQRGGEPNLIPIRGSTMKSWGGSKFRIRTCCLFSEFRRRYSHFA